MSYFAFLGQFSNVRASRQGCPCVASILSRQALASLRANFKKNRSTGFGFELYGGSGRTGLLPVGAAYDRFEVRSFKFAHVGYLGPPGRESQLSKRFGAGNAEDGGIEQSVLNPSCVG